VTLHAAPDLPAGVCDVATVRGGTNGGTTYEIRYVLYDACGTGAAEAVTDLVHRAYLDQGMKDVKVTDSPSWIVENALWTGARGAEQFVAVRATTFQEFDWVYDTVKSELIDGASPLTDDAIVVIAQADGGLIPRP